LVWRGKDYQDWSDLVVQAPPLYIQEKVHPKVLIDDLLKESKGARAQETGVQIDLFADFNGAAEGADRTDFYQHDQNWTNRMILRDSPQSCPAPPRARGRPGKGNACPSTPRTAASAIATYPCPLPTAADRHDAPGPPPGPTCAGLLAALTS